VARTEQRAERRRDKGSQRGGTRAMVRR
jgi:hypothetical protein